MMEDGKDEVCSSLRSLMHISCYMAFFVIFVCERVDSLFAADDTQKQVDSSGEQDAMTHHNS